VITMQIAALVVVACVLALIGGVRSDCCRTKVDLLYKISNGGCGDVGGQRSGDFCKIKICASGEALVGSWCGRGSCNWFGCACKNGCVSGNWTQDFLAKNRRYNIQILDAKWR
ncbi:hypothetical protein KR038_003655, partial [Drosophila bunnanda]